MKRSFADMAAAVLRQLSATAAGWIVVPLVGVQLDTEALGLWILLGSAAALPGLADLGLTIAAQRAAVAGDADRARRVIGLAVRIGLAVGPMLALLAWPLLLDVPASRWDSQLRIATPIVLLAVLAQAFGSAHRGFVIVRGGMRGLAKVRAAASLAQVVVAAGGLVITRSLVAPALGLLVGNVCEAAAVVALARGIDPRVRAWPERARGDEARRAFVDGSAALAIAFATTLAVRIDLLVLVRHAPLAAVAAYGIALRAVDQSYVLAKQTSSALLPRLGARSDRSEVVTLGTACLGSLVASGMIALALPGRVLLDAWAGGLEAHADLALPLVVLGVAAIVTSVQEMASVSLTFAGRSAWAGARPIVVGALVNVAISVLGAPRFGVVAVAGSTLVGAIVTATGSWSAARRDLGWTWAQVGRATLPALAALSVALPLGLVLHAASGVVDSALRACVVAAAGTAVGVGGAWLLRPSLLPRAAT